MEVCDYLILQRLVGHVQHQRDSVQVGCPLTAGPEVGPFGAPAGRSLDWFLPAYLMFEASTQGLELSSGTLSHKIIHNVMLLNKNNET